MTRPAIFPTSGTNASLLEMRAGSSSAQVSTHGAQVMSLDLGFGELLWTGGHQPGPGKDCWGGIPICWPWFMNGCGEEPIGPFHGPARSLEWRILKREEHAGRDSVLVLGLPGPVTDSRGGAYPLDAELRLTLGRVLCMELQTTNAGDRAVPLEHCFHAYFLTGDVTRVTVKASEAFRTGSASPRDGGDSGKGPGSALSFTGFFSEVYSPFPNGLHASDPVLGREIHLVSRNASHLVVWNSGPPRVAAGRPTGEAEWRSQLALEPLRGMGGRLLLQPGTTALLDLEIRCLPLAGA